VRLGAARHLGLLSRSRPFASFAGAAFASGLGTWLAFVALTIDVYDRTGSGSWVAALLFVDVLPTVALGLALGPLIDRLSRKRLMIGADLARLAVFACLPFAQSPAQIVVLAGVAGVANGFFQPALYAALPNLVDESDLGSANAFLRTIENLTLTGGSLLGGTIVAASGPDVAYWLNAFSYAVSALLLMRIASKRFQAEASLSEGHWRDLASGFSVVRGSPVLLAVLIAWSLALFAVGGSNVAEVLLAKRSFNAGDFGFAVLVAGAGAGLVVGSAASGRLIARMRPARLYAGAIGLIALGIGAAAASPNVWLAAICVAVSGAGNGIAIVCNGVFVQRGTTDQFRGRVFALLMSATSAAVCLGMLVGGPLADAIGPRSTWGGSALLLGLAAVTGFLLARRGANLLAAQSAPAGTVPEVAAPPAPPVAPA